MSEKFLEKFTEMLFGAIVVFLLLTSSTIVLLAWISTQNMIFYYGYIGALGSSFIYVLYYAQQFRNFKETLHLFLPPEKPFEPLSMELEDLPLKVCLDYRNGASYEVIAQNLGIDTSYQVKRELVKGLDILLREHNGKKAIT
jgi:hypothetical protein